MEQEQLQPEDEYTDDGESGGGGSRLFLVAGAVFLAAAIAAAFWVFGKNGNNAIDSGEDKNSNAVPTAGQLKPVDPNSAKSYNYTAPAANDCLLLDTEEEVASCQDKSEIGDIISGKDIEKCSILKTQSSRTDCRLAIAQDSGNPELCGRIEDKTAEGRCVSAIAVAEKNADICIRLEETGKQMCEDQVAAQIIAQDGVKTDLNKCEDIKTGEFAALCLLNSYIYKFNGDCTQVPQVYRDDCEKKLGSN